MVRDFELSCVFDSIMVNVEVGPSRESIVCWFGGRRSKVVMDVRKAVDDQQSCINDMLDDCAYTVVKQASPGPAGILLSSLITVTGRKYYTLNGNLSSACNRSIMVM